MGSSKLIAALFLALALAVATTSQATRAEPPSLALALAPSPSPSAPPEPATTSCMSWFMGMTPCMDFFTDADVAAPSSTCCKGLESLVDGAAVCLCHAMNGDIDNFMPANTDFSRVSDLPATCGVALPVETLSECYTEPVPPLLPPSPAA
ncbi:hypothetical protein SETIT_2G309700v2 [Setaria italica]|uniref:Bifunctional inhibitor/plant lipid transfer protein/seed storage helical domain-containing protein n=1 Tax=Setaria italica TaxID=4555 RepID=A0A368Q549_SETIT|nr:hypothetical protein SETIT_2G309700v2 [Setaria italica]